MVPFLFRWMKSSTSHEINSTDTKLDEPQSSLLPDETLENHKDDVLSGSVVQTTNFIYDLLGHSDDFVMRTFQVFGQYPATLYYLSSLSVCSARRRLLY